MRSDYRWAQSEGQDTATPNDDVYTATQQADAPYVVAQLQADTPTQAVGGVITLTATVTSTASPAPDGTLVTFGANLGDIWARSVTSAGVALALVTSDVAGTAHISATTQGADGEAQSTLDVTFTALVSECIPLAGAVITGPPGVTDTLYIGMPYTFTAVITPTDATPPITYTWSPTPTSGQGKSWATYVWSVEGEESITVTAQNAGGATIDTHTVVISQPSDPCPTPLNSVTLLGPTAGYTGMDYVFTAVISPAEATLPFTYTWTPEPNSGQGASVVTYTWDVTGTPSLVVLATNCGATVSDAQAVAIQAWPQTVSGDAYEPDDVCGAQTTLLPSDGAVQAYTFHAYADEDWVPFAVTMGVTYVVQARVPSTSSANLTLELYEACEQALDGERDQVFGPDARFTFVAPTSGVYHLRLQNEPLSVYGADVAYHLSIRDLRETEATGAVVIVAGKRRDDDPLQGNIQHVTDAAYRFASEHGCTAEQIYYLSTDDSLLGFDDTPTADTLEYALTEWAADKVDSNSLLTLFMMDHGGSDEFYLNGPDETVTPDQLDGWLEQLEAQTGARLNVVIDACHSGSFIEPEQTVSREGRVVIASTKSDALAYASQEGAVFSDAFFNALEQEMTLLEAFQDAWSVGQSSPGQTPWLDDDGDGTPNEAQDGALAALRGFACDVPEPVEQSPPYIVQAEVKRLRVDKGRGEIWAEVKDDREVKRVWAVVYSPSYPSPEPGEELVEPLLQLELRWQGNDWYGDWYIAFDEIGEYRVVIYAEDDGGLTSLPEEITVRTGWAIYLPLVVSSVEGLVTRGNAGQAAISPQR
jgi:hypothetical protein